jgi:hypothetical protein
LEGTYATDNPGVEAKALPTGEKAACINPKWVDKLKDLIERQTSSAPLTMEQLDEAIAAHKKALLDQSRSDETPAQAQTREATEKAREKAQTRASAKKKITNAISAAVADKDAPLEVDDVIRSIKEAGLPMPEATGLDPIRMTEEEARAVVHALFKAHNVKAVWAMYQELSKGIAQLKALAQEQAETAAALVAKAA